jgi:hypothetical protein
MSPFVSKAQQKWMFKNKPEMAKEWASKTKDIKSLPYKVKKRHFKYKVDNKLRGCVGITDFDKGEVKINKSKAKKRGRGEVLKTIKHEVDHINHPKMHEKTVYAREKDTPNLSKKEKAKLYRLFNQKKFDKQVKRTFNI